MTITEPGLTDEAVEQIEATMPKCPECGSPIELIHFVSRSTHRFHTEIDGNGGDVLGYSRHYDTLETKPETEWGGVLVSCQMSHTWFEPRLKLKRNDSTGAEWEIEPMPPVCLYCHGAHWSRECPFPSPDPGAGCRLCGKPSPDGEHQACVDYEAAS